MTAAAKVQVTLGEQRLCVRPKMLVALVALSAVVLYYLLSWLHFRLKYDIHKIPAPPSYPFVGHLFDFLRMERLNYNSWTLDWAKKLGCPKVMKVRSAAGVNRVRI